MDIFLMQPILSKIETSAQKVKGSESAHFRHFPSSPRPSTQNSGWQPATEELPLSALCCCRSLTVNGLKLSTLTRCDKATPDFRTEIQSYKRTSIYRLLCAHLCLGSCEAVYTPTDTRTSSTTYTKFPPKTLFVTENANSEPAPAGPNVR